MTLDHASSLVPEKRRANRGELAAFFEVSPRTIDEWSRAGCPIVRKGKGGVQSVYDLLAVARWRFAPADSDGGENGQIDPEKLPPAERKAWYDSEHRRRDLQVRDRELIPKDEAAVAIATAFSAVAQAVRSLPDHLERRYALAPDVVGGVEQALNDALDELADRLSAISPVDNDAID